MYRPVSILSPQEAEVTRWNGILKDWDGKSLSRRLKWNVVPYRRSNEESAFLFLLRVCPDNSDYPAKMIERRDCCKSGPGLAFSPSNRASSNSK